MVLVSKPCVAVFMVNRSDVESRKTRVPKHTHRSKSISSLTGILRLVVGHPLQLFPVVNGDHVHILVHL